MLLLLLFIVAWFCSVSVGGRLDEEGHRFICYARCVANCESKAVDEDCAKACRTTADNILCVEGDTNCWQHCGNTTGHKIFPSDTKLPPDMVFFDDTSVEARPHYLNFTWVECIGATYYIIKVRDWSEGGFGSLEKKLLPGNTTWYEYRKPNLCGRYQFSSACVYPDEVTDFSGPAENLAPKFHWKGNSLYNVSMKMIESKRIRIKVHYRLPVGLEPSDVNAVEIIFHPIQSCSSDFGSTDKRIDEENQNVVDVLPYKEGCKFAIMLTNVMVCGKDFSGEGNKGGSSVVIDMSDCKSIEGAPCGDTGEDICATRAFCIAKVSYKAIDQDPCSNVTDVGVSFKIDKDQMNENVYRALNCTMDHYEIRYGMPHKIENPVPGLQMLLGQSLNEIGRLPPISVGNESFILHDAPVMAPYFVVQICAAFTRDMNSSYLNKAFDLSMISLIEPEKQQCVIAAKAQNTTKLAISIGLPLSVALIVAVAVLGLVYRKTQQDVAKMRRMSSILLDSKYADFSTRPDIQDKWEIDRRRLIIYEEETLGKGAFGKVFKGKIIGRAITAKHAKSAIITEQEHADDMTVAVKQSYEFADESTKKDFLQEILLMKKLYYHQRLVNILHCITVNEPLSLVVEYCSEGDLLHYLRQRRKYMTQLMEQGIDLTDPESQADIDQTQMIRLRDVVQMGFQVADGMEYISQKEYVHRDLAARNVLVDGDRHLKIGDFGLTRYIHTDSIYLARGGKLPIKWMALEAIERYEFTTKSDVWSFGVLLFEIVTLGGAPYPDIMPMDGDFRKAMLQHLMEGNRMEQPDNCPTELYRIMLDTWKSDPDNRPSFTIIKEILRSLVEQLANEDEGNYCDFYIDPAQSYYNVGHPDDDEMTADESIASPPLELSPGQDLSVEFLRNSPFDDATSPNLDSGMGEESANHNTDGLHPLSLESKRASTRSAHVNLAEGLTQMSTESGYGSGAMNGVYPYSDTRRSLQLPNRSSRNDSGGSNAPLITPISADTLAERTKFRFPPPSRGLKDVKEDHIMSDIPSPYSENGKSGMLAEPV